MCFSPLRLGFAQEGEKERAKEKKTHTHEKTPLWICGFLGRVHASTRAILRFFYFFGGFWARALVIG